MLSRYFFKNYIFVLILLVVPLSASAEPVADGFSEERVGEVNTIDHDAESIVVNGQPLVLPKAHDQIVASVTGEPPATPARSLRAGMTIRYAIDAYGEQAGEPTTIIVLGVE